MSFIIICGLEGDPLLRAGGWSEMICALFHMRASQAPRNCKSAPLEQLWIPSAPHSLGSPAPWSGSRCSRCPAPAPPPQRWMWMENPRVAPATVPLCLSQKGFGGVCAGWLPFAPAAGQQGLTPLLGHSGRGQRGWAGGQSDSSTVPERLGVPYRKQRLRARLKSIPR